MNVEEFNESQKTVYVLRRKPSKRQKLDLQPVANDEALSINDPNLPFLQLLNSDEPLENVKLRYTLYKKSIKSQNTISKRILDEISDQTLTNINNIINQPLNQKQIDSVLLLSSASFTSSSSFTSQLTDHLINGENNSHRVIRLSSKECNTIKITLKKIVTSILDDALVDGNNAIDNDSDDMADEDSDEEADEEGEEDDEDDMLMGHKRLPFDLDTIDEWCQQIFYKRNETIENTSLRIALFFEDTDSFNMGLLNQLVRLIHRFTDRIPFKLIFNVGTNVENFAKKLDNDLHFALKFHQFNIEQTESILNKIVSEIIIQDDFLIGNESIYFLLKRFDNSIRDVKEFLKSLKFLKMCFFYNQPLSVICGMQLNDKKLSLNPKYFLAIRMLPSFKRYIEHTMNSNDPNKGMILGLLNNDDELQKLVIKSTNYYLKNLSNFRSVFHFITKILMKYITISTKNYLEYLAKLTNKDELIRNQFINEILMSLKKLEIESMENLLIDISEVAATDDLLQSLNSKIKAASIDLVTLKKSLDHPESSKIQFKIEYRKLLESLLSIIENFLKKTYQNPVELLFNEMFQFNDLEILKSTMIPQTRTIIEDSLTDPELYIHIKAQDRALGPLEKLNSKLNPIITELFQIYRETSLNLNIYDFYQVFKNSLREDEIMNDLMEVLDSSDNLLENYLNDSQRFKFIYQFFNDVDIPQDLKFDKLMLVLFLQKCGELIDCGFLKQIKRKGDSLEKCVWRGL